MQPDSWRFFALAAIASPLGYLASNQFRAPSLARLGVIVAFLFVAQLLALAVLKFFRVSPGAAAPAIAIATVALTFCGPFVSRLAPTPWLASLIGLLMAVALALVLVVAAGRWTETPRLLHWILVGLVVAPVVTMVLSSSPAVARAVPRQRDVVVLFLDGYAGDDSLQELYEFDNSSFVSQLERKGFDVMPDAKASYSMTYASVASILDMDFAVEAGFAPDRELRPTLYRLMQGDNAFVESARSLGYEYIHVESGWGGTSCGPAVDTCIRAPFLEDTTWTFLQRTFVGPLMPIWFGHSFAHDALDRVDKLNDLRLDDQVSELVVAHLLIPHPPLFLDGDCDLRFMPELDGMNIGTGSESPDKRRARLEAYTDQISCVNRAVLETVGNPGIDGAIVALVGDHGTDAQGQLVTQVSEWDDSMISERMHTFMAVRGCDGDMPSSNINILRFVSSCAFDQPLEMLPARQFLVPVTENHPADSIIEVSQ
jgi:hypothetical protein